jgi:hypothetical protein
MNYITLKPFLEKLHWHFKISAQLFLVSIPDSKHDFDCKILYYENSFCY